MMRLSRPQYGLQQEIVQAIYALRQKKSSQIFREAVDISKVPDYLDYIKTPMDLTKILTKLKAGEYEYSQDVYQDLLLIISNCKKYNRAADAFIKKAEQFMECINTVWGNFKKQIMKKRISYNQKISINQDLLKRIAIIEQKRTRKKIPVLQSVIEQEKKNILPQTNMLPPLQIQFQKGDKQDLPPSCQFNPQKYSSYQKQQKRDLLSITLDTDEILDQFQKLSDKKLEKYKKILKKRLLWFDEKIIQKCLKKKNFEKMQVPKHLNNFIQKGQIAQQLNIRKLQMYVKKITYWVEDNSNILSDYMKDRFVQNCRILKKCILRVLKYKKSKQRGQLLDMSLDLRNIKSQFDLDLNIQNDKQEDNYENKMKQFKRMLDKDREKSTKRDTKIILRNQNGVMQVYDWTSDKKQERGVRKQGGGGTRIQQVDNDQKKKQEQRRRQQLRKDEQFLQDYSKKSNVLLIGKYGNRLKIDWQLVQHRNLQFTKQTLINFTDDDIQQ